MVDLDYLDGVVAHDAVNELEHLRSSVDGDGDDCRVPKHVRQGLKGVGRMTMHMYKVRSCLV